MIENKCDTVESAIKLMDYTFGITTNKEKYPTKYTRLIKRIQDTSFDIYEFVIDANRTNLKTHKQERLDLQSKAITACDKLSCYAELSYRHKRISSDSLYHWQKLISDVKYMAIAWRDSNRNSKNL